MWERERSRWIKEMQSEGLMRNEGQEDVQGGAFLAGWRRRQMVSSTLEKPARCPSADIR